MSAGCCGCAIASPDGAERRPPWSAAAALRGSGRAGAWSFDRASVVASAAAGATVATAEASAARRANSRREMLGALAGLGLDASSIKSPFVPRKDTPAAGREEATESRVERQQRVKEGEDKEARREINLGELAPPSNLYGCEYKGVAGKQLQQTFAMYFGRLTGNSGSCAPIPMRYNGQVQVEWRACNPAEVSSRLPRRSAPGRTHAFHESDEQCLLVETNDFR